MSKNEQFPTYRPNDELLEVLPYPHQRERSLGERFRLKQLRLLEKAQGAIEHPEALNNQIRKLKGNIEDMQLKSGVKNTQLEDGDNNPQLESREVHEFTDESARMITLIDLDDPGYQDLLIERFENKDPLLAEEIQVANLYNILKNSHSIDWVHAYQGRAATLTSTGKSLRDDEGNLITTKSKSSLFIDHNLKDGTYKLTYSGVISDTGGENPEFTRISEKITIDPQKKLCTITQVVNDEPIRERGGRVMSYEFLEPNPK